MECIFILLILGSRRGNCSQGGREDCQERISYMCIHDFLQGIAVLQAKYSFRAEIMCRHLPLSINDCQ
uniref:Secreted protein n=1 Tax=Triticum urartu TaxID=4572 RepID=A0A8R7Q4J7_TRIUA